MFPFLFCLVTGPHYIAQAVLKLTILLGLHHTGITGMFLSTEFNIHFTPKKGTSYLIALE